jgi:hypothetical protein
MASVFTNDGDTFTITQTSRGFRLGFKLFIGCGVMGVGLMVLLSHLKEPTTLACDHARQSCTLTKSGVVTELPLAPFRSIELTQRPRGGVVIELNRNQYPNYLQICGTTGDAAARQLATDHAAALKAFLADGNHAPLDLACTSQDLNMPNPFALGVLFLGGLFILVLLFLRFTTELRARFDRKSGLVTVTGSRWLARRRSMERALADVARIEVRAQPGLRGSRYFNLYARFSDGSAVLIWAPGAASAQQMAARQAELQQFLAKK